MKRHQPGPRGDQAGTKSLSANRIPPLREERAAQRLERSGRVKTAQKTTQETTQKLNRVKRGIGRTGTVVGCYLVRHGLCQAHEAVDRIRALRKCKYTEDHNEPSPESRRQFEMVLSWGFGK